MLYKKPIYAQKWCFYFKWTNEFSIIHFSWWCPLIISTFMLTADADCQHSLKQLVFKGQYKNQKKLKQNFSFAGTKTKDCVPSWVCDVCAFGCCSASSTAGTFWVVALPLRLKTHFFGGSDTTLTCADANSVGNWELVQIPVFSSPPKSIFHLISTILILQSYRSPFWIILCCFFFSSSIFWR